MKKIIFAFSLCSALSYAQAGLILSPEMLKMQEDVSASRLKTILSEEKQNVSLSAQDLATLKNKSRIEFFEKVCAAQEVGHQNWIAAVPKKEQDLSLLAMTLIEPSENKISPTLLLSLHQNSSELYVAKSDKSKATFQHTKNIKLQLQTSPFSYAFIDPTPSLCKESQEYENSLFKDVMPVLLEQYLASALGKSWRHSSNIAQGVLLFESSTAQIDENIVNTLKSIAMPYVQSSTIIFKNDKESALSRWIFMHEGKTYFLSKESNSATTTYQLYVTDKSKK